jgi:hypothetical protein
MTGRAAAIFTVLFVSLVGAQATNDWRHWQYVASVDAPPAESSRLVAVTIPAGLTARARDGWADVRVVDANGREVPYLIDPGSAPAPVPWRTARILEPSVAAGGFSQIVLDAGSAPETHHALRLDVVRERDFLTWIEIAVSDDGRSWRVVRDRAPFFDLSDQGMGSTKSVVYPASPARYLRVRFLDASRRYDVRGADVSGAVRSPVPLEPAGVTLVSSGGSPQQSAWATPPGTPRTAVAGIRFETPAESLFRPVAVHASDDGRDWTYMASGEILRSRSGGTLRESLDVDVPERWAAHWRVTVYDRDEAPLGSLKVTLLTRPRRLVFQQDAGGAYRVIYGHARATPPQYFLSRIIDRGAIDRATPVPLGPERVNPDYADPRPWTERNPFVLWLALGAAVLVLAGLAIRTLRPASRS